MVNLENEYDQTLLHFIRLARSQHLSNQQIQTIRALSEAMEKRFPVKTKSPGVSPGDLYWSQIPSNLR